MKYNCKLKNTYSYIQFIDVMKKMNFLIRTLKKKNNKKQ